MDGYSPKARTHITKSHTIFNVYLVCNCYIFIVFTFIVLFYFFLLFFIAIENEYKADMQDA